MSWIRIFVILCMVYTSHAQNYLSNEWYIEIGKVKAQFQLDTVLVKRFFDSDSLQYRCPAGNSNICDSTGNLKLAVSPFVAMNGSTSGFIEGGSAINNEGFASYYQGTSPYGNTTLILPKGANQYYIFNTTVSDSYLNTYITGGQGSVGFKMDQLRYSIVDMGANNGVGKVVVNNQLLLTSPDLYGFNITNMTATRHANGKDWWLIKPSGQDKTSRYTYLVTENELKLFNIEQLPKLTNNFIYQNIGQSCFSKDGTLYAESNSDAPTTIWRFDRCSGQFTFLRSFDIIKLNKDTTTPFPSATGVCFSDNNRYLYQGEFFSIYQFDLQEQNDTLALHCFCEQDTSKNFSNNNSFQMTPYGQIYIGHWHGISPDVDAIMQPDQYGADAFHKLNYYQQQKIWYNVVGTNDPPNMINYALGKLPNSPCDTIKTTTSLFANWSLSPNPNEGNLEVKVPVNNAQQINVNICNVLGQRVRAFQNKIDYTYKVNLDINSLAAGMYYVQCITDNGSSFNTKIIKL
jgi:hypothetical protein